jgi:hypothetical protein
MRKLLGVLLLALVVLLHGESSHAKTYSFSCQYEYAHTGVYENGEYKYDTGKNFSFTITLDTETNKAYLTGNNGSVEVQPIYNAEQVSFLQVSGSELVVFTTLTTITWVAEKDGKFLSVHSRQNRIGSSFGGEQHYGFCKPY